MMEHTKLNKIVKNIVIPFVQVVLKLVHKAQFYKYTPKSNQ